MNRSLGYYAAFAAGWIACTGMAVCATGGAGDDTCADTLDADGDGKADVPFVVVVRHDGVVLAAAPYSELPAGTIEAAAPLDDRRSR